MSVQHPVLFFPGTLCDERIFLPLWRTLSIAQRRYVPLQWAASQEEMFYLTTRGGPSILFSNSVIFSLKIILNILNLSEKKNITVC